MQVKLNRKSEGASLGLFDRKLHTLTLNISYALSLLILSPWYSRYHLGFQNHWCHYLHHQYHLAPTSPCHVSLAVIYLNKFSLVLDFWSFPWWWYFNMETSGIENLKKIDPSTVLRYPNLKVGEYQIHRIIFLRLFHMPTPATLNRPNNSIHVLYNCDVLYAA